MKNSRLAYENIDFLKTDPCRPVRLQLEFLYPEVKMTEHQVNSTVVLFGSARIPSPEQRELSPNTPLAKLTSFYEEARKLAQIISRARQTAHERPYVVVTGGGGGIMEAGNRGANDVGCTDDQCSMFDAQCSMRH